MPRQLSLAQPDRVADVTRRREALEALITSEGWQIVLSHAVREFEGTGYKVRMRAALAKGITEAQVVDRVAQELFRFLQWPGDQVRELKGSVDNE